MNDLQLYFETNERRLIHKWTHYFEIYDRHLSKFRNRDVCVVEIGVFHGGSLQMWKSYFGSQAKIIGIDIDPRCKAFEEEGIEIFIGSQEDRNFLASLKAQIPHIDILLDDGGHTMRQQITTFEELFPHVSETGIYLCEDLHTSYWHDYGGGFHNPDSYLEYSKNLIDSLNAWHTKDPKNFRVTDFTRSAYAMHYYDSVLVIEKRPMSAPFAQMSGYPVFEERAAIQAMEQLKEEALQLKKHAPSEFRQGSIGSSTQKLPLEVQQIQTELEDLRFKLSQSDIYSKQLQVELEQMKSLLQQKQNALKQIRDRLKRVKLRMEESQSEITAIKTSKLWKLQLQWSSLKKIFGI